MGNMQLVLVFYYCG